jgi:hypothetical protein
MKNRKILFYSFCIILFACNSNKNFYANNLQIEPSVLAEMDTAHYTLIQWKDSLQNFGTIKSGDSARLKYTFTNIGETPLFVFNTRTTCGCTITDFSKDPVMPGKSGFVTVVYKSNSHSGEINKAIIVVADTRKSKYSHLIIRGVVKPAQI